MALPRVDLSRSSSSSSVASLSDEPVLSGSRAPTDGTVKRTRKRFTEFQLTMLDQLYHSTSHPSRQEREALSQELDLDSKAVTIWFQNRRQNERKATINAHSASSPAARPTPRRRKTSLPHSFSSPYAPVTPRTKRPTLEAMARRSELRTAPPRTQTKRSDPRKSLWDNMPSSPLVPPSPPEPEYVQFGMGKRRHVRSLEWACAAARLVGKQTGPHDGNETDEEDPHEAITPMGSLSGDPEVDVFWVGPRTTKKGTKEKPKDREDDLMDAARLLCELGRQAA
ncbi:hypothetical protein BC834DRAFT_14237 [Gloeopeniophorella convolvens]|nr:hypothetical protein BC834DRAFT_14237 [Gloeopeniophorella convolvens]